ncbi:MAG: hypothetical protein V3S68_04410, partial [Dehalococcoidia bacterium]
MSSNENPDQDIERALQAHFESEAEGLRAPTGLWGRIEARLGDRLGGDVGGGAVPPVWQRLVRPGRWGSSPALAAMVLLVLAVSGTWLFTATPWQDDGAMDLALGGGTFTVPRESRGLGSYPTATPAPTAAPTAAPMLMAGATRAPAPTSIPSSAGPAGASGAAGAPGSACATCSTSNRGELGDTTLQFYDYNSAIAGSGFNQSNTDQWTIVDDQFARLPRVAATEPGA